MFCGWFGECTKMCCSSVICFQTPLSTPTLTLHSILHRCIFEWAENKKRENSWLVFMVEAIKRALIILLRLSAYYSYLFWSFTNIGFVVRWVGAVSIQWTQTTMASPIIILVALVHSFYSSVCWCTRRRHPTSVPFRFITTISASDSA